MPAPVEPNPDGTIGLQALAVHQVIPQSSGTWTDPNDGLEYRIVRPGLLTPEGGWGTGDFWVRELKTGWHIFKDVVRRGCFDCAVEQGTAIRRFRNLDPARTLAQRDAVRHRNQILGARQKTKPR